MPMPRPHPTDRPSRRRPLGAGRIRRVLTGVGGGLCVAALSGVLGLSAWALLPVAAGAQATVVLTGSMAPALMPGDVVMSTSVQPGDVQAGRVIWFADPSRAGRTLLHRAVAIEQDGTVVTRGDANGSDDPMPVGPDAVLGLPRLRVPVIGLPVLWATQQQWALVGATALAIAVVTRGALSVLVPAPRPGGAR